MPIAKTGDLNQIIKIILPGKASTNDFGDSVVSKNQEIYPKLYAMQRTKKADEIASDLDKFRDQVQFIIRHRGRTEPQITSDMHLIQVLSGNDIDYQIKTIDYDTEYQEWDVIICERIGQI